MINIDEYLDGKVKKGWVYFIYSEVKNTIYVGETSDYKRIEMYENIITNKFKYTNPWQCVNYFKKIINEELLMDLVVSENRFKVFIIETKYHKHLEKSYIRYLSKYKYYLYNSMYYKTHRYDEVEIDVDMVMSFNLTEHEERWLFQR